MFYLELANKHYALPIVQITGSRISFIGKQRLIMTPRIKLESEHWHRVIESPQKPHLFEQSMSLIHSTRFNEKHSSIQRGRRPRGERWVLGLFDTQYDPAWPYLQLVHTCMCRVVGYGFGAIIFASDGIVFPVWSLDGIYKLYQLKLQCLNAQLNKKQIPLKLSTKRFYRDLCFVARG